jgi:hypothetical protein
MNRLEVCLVFIAFAAGGICPTAPAAQCDGAYDFTLDGKPFTPMIISMNGDPAHPQPGDLLCVDRLLLTLGPERACHFVTTSQEDGRVWLQLANGEKRIVGASVTSSFPDNERVINDPLAKLSPAEIRGLWGIYLDEWPAGIADKLKDLDLVRACLTLSDHTADPQQGRLRALPADIQYLCIAERSNMGIRDYEALRELSKLRFLVVEAMSAKAFDAHLIARNRSLRYLVLRTHSILRAESLAGLEQMRWLDLAFIPDLTTVAFAEKMPELRTLNVSRTAVRDLSPLAAAMKLEEVSASMTSVEKLPARPLPALRTLDVFSTKLSDDAVARFIGLNPKCVTRFRWDEAFRQAVAGATRLRVRSGGTCHRDLSREKTLWELADAAKIRELAALIHIDEAQSGFECMCCGEPSFEFYQGDHLIATLGFHHGRSLRWLGEWPGDGMLTPETRDKLPKWFAEHGFDALQKAREAAAVQREQTAKQKQLFRGFFPEKARKLFDYSPNSLEDEPKQGERIAKAVGDPVETVVAACRALGALDGSWSYLDFDDRFAFYAADTANGEDFLKAMRRIRGDNSGELGAARLCFAQKYLTKLPATERSEWAEVLARAVLSHGREWNRSAVIPPLETLGDARSRALLWQVAHNEIPRESQPWTSSQEELGLRADAYLALAKLGDRGVKDEVERLLPGVPKGGADRAALEVSLALLGDARFVKSEHFTIPSFRIGFAAIQAIEKFGGREGLDALVEGGINHPWAAVNKEAALAIQRITGQTWFKNPENEMAWDHRKDIEKWWRENGAEFVRKQRAKK